MPRKTRKEKFAAKLHKQRINVNTFEDEKQPINLPLSAVNTVLQQSVPKKTVQSTVTKNFFDDNVRPYFLQDLRKSLIVITAILLLELTVFLANQAGLLTFINF